jgi:hypothetical protein
VYGFTLEALAAAVLLGARDRRANRSRASPDPDLLVLPGAVALLALRTIDDPSLEWALSALGAGLVLFLIVLVYPRGMGMGT